MGDWKCSRCDATTDRHLDTDLCGPCVKAVRERALVRTIPADTLQAIQESQLKNDSTEGNKRRFPPNSASDFLRRSDSILSERGQDYDKPEGERSMGRTVEAFNSITGHKLTEADGWLLLQVLKDVRQWTKDEFHEDSAVDCISYAALKAEALANA